MSNWQALYVLIGALIGLLFLPWSSLLSAKCSNVWMRKIIAQVCKYLSCASWAVACAGCTVKNNQYFQG
ncbi:hypothetical protein [Pseudomonas hunanensis]|uniref:hypothetical protein n=1 Tax=Pseudomonas TaxID=286 RepID=UPI0011AF3EA3|nr:hypothetical protein [Pseudomonas hunanensis]